jgi:arylsulfatase A
MYIRIMSICTLLLVCSIVFAQNKPNVIFILSDDLGYNDLGCYGQQILKTPHIDKLASEGMKFNRFYSGAPVCAPARSVLMTSKHVGHGSVRGNQPKGQLLKDSEETLAKTFRNAGYATGLIGKWGLGNAPEPNDPKRNGFDYHYGYVNMWHAHNFFPEFLYKNGEKVYLNNKTGSIPPGNYPEGVGLATVRNEYAPDLFDREALNFIEENKTQPFFLFYAMNTPHGNSEYKVDGNGMEVPDTKAFDHTDWPNAEKGFAEMMRKLDITVGLIQEKIKELGLEENTIIVFSSDNGPHSECNHDPNFFNSAGILRGQKRDLYEGGVRVPFIIKYKDVIKSGLATDQIYGFWDVMPTFRDMLNLNKLKDVDGKSFWPVISGKGKAEQHKYLYWEFYEENGKQGVLFNDWKGIRLNTNNLSHSRLELYNLKEDPSEKNNLATANPKMVKKILKIMEKEHQPFPLTSLFKKDESAQRDVQAVNK